MAYNTIIVKGDGEQYEALANAAITPGQLVELMSTGKVRKVTAASAEQEKLVAIEDYLQGKTIAQDYAADAICLHRAFKSGDEVLLILADGQNVAIGDMLESAGGGEVKKYSAGVKLFVAREAVDASDSATTAVADRRIIGRVI